MNTRYEVPVKVLAEKELNEKLGKLFGQHPNSVARSLNGRSNSELAVKMRHVAVKEYGATVLESKVKTGIRKWTGYWLAEQRCMVFDFGDGRELRHYEDTEEAVYMADGCEVERRGCTVLEADAWAKELCR